MWATGWTRGVAHLRPGQSGASRTPRRTEPLHPLPLSAQAKALYSLWCAKIKICIAVFPPIRYLLYIHITHKWGVEGGHIMRL